MPRQIHVHVLGRHSTYDAATSAARRAVKHEPGYKVYVDSIEGGLSASNRPWVVWMHGNTSEPSAKEMFGSRYHQTIVEAPRYEETVAHEENPRARNQRPRTKSDLAQRMRAVENALYDVRGTHGMRDVQFAISDFLSSYAAGESDIPTEFVDRMRELRDEMQNLDFQMGQTAGRLGAVARDLDKASAAIPYSRRRNPGDDLVHPHRSRR
jgi:hypothetical protein